MLNFLRFRSRSQGGIGCSRPQSLDFLWCSLFRVVDANAADFIPEISVEKADERREDLPVVWFVAFQSRSPRRRSWLYEAKPIRCISYDAIWQIR
jgi:hypothetical protein